MRSIRSVKVNNQSSERLQNGRSHTGTFENEETAGKNSRNANDSQQKIISETKDSDQYQINTRYHENDNRSRQGSSNEVVAAYNQGRRSEVNTR